MRPSPPAARPSLAAVARERMLLVLEIDGALAPATRALLRTAALLYPCAAVSARPRAEAAAALAGVPLVAVLGSHGAEPGFGPVDRALVREAERCDARAAAALRGEAVGALRRRLGVPGALYLGDGPADADAVHLWPERGVPVDAALQALVTARLAEDGRGARWQGLVRAVGGGA